MKAMIFLVIIMFIAVNCFAYELKLTIPDDKAQLVADSFCKAYNYQATIKDMEEKDVPNPETKAQFTKKCIIQYIKEIVKAVKANEAAEQARQSAIINPNNDVNIQ